MATFSPVWVRRRKPREAAGFLLPLSSTAALILLLSGLSLQTSALQARRQQVFELQNRQQHDLLASAAQQLVGRLTLQHPCLLERALASWAGAPCLGEADPQGLAQGVMGEHRYRLLSWQPTATGVELRLGLAAGGPSAAFALVAGALRELGLRAAAGGAV